MRLAVVLAALLITACGARSSSRPAWPKMAEREADGGESLSPRQGARSIAAAADDDDEDDDIKVVATPTAATPAAVTPSTSTSSPTVTAPEESITIEDIVIEIDD